MRAKSLFKTIFLCAAFLIFVTGTCLSADNLFEEGAHAYARGEYDQALRLFTASGETGGVSAALYYNTGNAWLMKREPVTAILWYERALALSPESPDIAANLALARKQAGLIQPEASLASRAFGFLSLNAWTLGAVGSLILLGMIFMAKGLFGTFFSRPSAKKAAAWALVLCFAVLAVSSAGAAVGVAGLDRAMVTADGARLFVSPFPEARATLAVPRGLILDTGEHYGGFVRVSDSTGRSGWLPENFVELVVPS